MGKPQTVFVRLPSSSIDNTNTIEPADTKFEQNLLDEKYKNLVEFYPS